LLDDFKDQHGHNDEKKKSRCFQTLGVASLLLAVTLFFPQTQNQELFHFFELLAVVGVFAFFALPESQTNTADSSAPFLKAPHHRMSTFSLPLV
jgi:hypothetical protein